MPIALEVCVTSVKDAIAAERAGATRIELCSSLEVGGLTPSAGLMRTVAKRVHIPVHALIRPRAGDFIYDEDELTIMKADISAAYSAGCAGVVLGVLNGHNEIDQQALLDLSLCANDLSITFHRAFDDVQDQARALEDVLKASGSRCTRILTSGGKDSAPHAQQQIRNLIECAGEKIIIMPGAGIIPENVKSIVAATGAKEVHASCKRTMGIENQPKSLFASPRWETDEAVVKKMVELLRD